MFGKSKQTVLIQYVLPGAIMLLLAIVSTYFVFAGGRFYVSDDGVFYLSRFESIYQSLAVGEWPSRLNFIGFNHQGAAITGMYPWLSSWMFLVPRFFVSPMWSLMIGFLILNLMTIVATWFLMRRLTDKPLLQWLGLILYQFNGYHFIAMYSRGAFAEGIGYLALPIVVLGLIDIWQERKWGWAILGFGMSIAANGHVLSLILLSVMVSVVELCRLVTKKANMAEVWELIKGTLLALMLSAYTLFTMFGIMSQNTLTRPNIRWTPMIFQDHLTYTLSNDFRSTSSPTMGLMIEVLLVIFVIAALFKLNNRGARLILLSAGIFVCTFSFVLGYEFINTPLSMVQFSMRLLMFVSLLLAMGIVLYLHDGDFSNKKKGFTIVMMGVVLIGAIHGMRGFHQDKTQNQASRVVSGGSYYRRIQYHHAKDYVLRKETGIRNTLDMTKEEDKRKLDQEILYSPGVAKAFEYQDSTYDSVTWEQNTKKAGPTKLPAIGYAGVDYTVLVNGVEAKYERKEGHLFVDLPVGKNTIVISGR